MRKKFIYVTDAENEAKDWASKHTHHQLTNLKVVPVTEKVEKKRGLPKKNEPLNRLFRIEGKIDIDEDAFTEESKKFARFVLASSDVDLDPEVMLDYCKGQQAVEHGFRFSKDKCFHVSKVYFKREERIESLCVTMVQSLLIYSFAEWRFSERNSRKRDKQCLISSINQHSDQPCGGFSRCLWG